MIAVVTKNMGSIAETSAHSGWELIDQRSMNTAAATTKTHSSMFYKIVDGTEGGSFTFNLGNLGGATSNGVTAVIGAFT